MAYRFRIGAHIGSGGFGTVEEATRISESGTEEGGLAQKKLLDKWLSDAEAVERFKREVRLLDELDHPNILPVLGRNLSDIPPWFIMPRAETNLADEVKVGRGSDNAWVCRTYSSVLLGMAYAHSQRVLHRDLKPENVLIVGGMPMVSDFGLGRRIDPSTIELTQSNIGMGTMAYMAPEQFTDFKRVGPPADVYALGKMLWEMLTGSRPVVGRPDLDRVPDEYRSFVDRCTQENEADRFASASDALVAFQLLVGGPEQESVAGADLEAQLRLWESIPQGSDEGVVEAISQTLVARRTDEELYFQTVPRLPTVLITQLMNQQPGEFDTIIRSYNGHIQGGLPFDYCDVVANFYRRVFLETKNFEHKRLLLQRLVVLGPSHNRWHVGETVAELLASITERSIAEMAADVLGENERNARWIKGYIGNRQLANPIARAFLDADPPPEAPS